MSSHYELTGRRRYRFLPCVDSPYGRGVMALEVERTQFREGAWETFWDTPKPTDLPGSTVLEPT